MKKALLLLAISAALTLSVSAKRIVVNLSQQRACAYEGGRTVFCGNISTGKPGHRTPGGHYRVLEKDLDHISSKYPEPNGGAKMHYMLRVTGGGIAMHLGYVPSYPASHGCIRMQNGFAQRMYSWARVGTPISIIGSPPSYVNRSSYSRTYGSQRVAKRSASRSRRTSRSRRRSYNATATDILAEFMGRPVSRRSIRKKSTSRRKSTRRKRRISRKRRRRHTPRHGNPLHAMRG